MAEQRSRAANKKPESEGRMPAIRPLAFWYVIMMLILLWVWQDAFRQVAMRTIAYSEFKTRLVRGELSECIVEEDEITGKVTPKTPAEAGSQTGKAATALEAPFHFRKRAHRGSQTCRRSSESGCRIQRCTARDTVARPLGVAAADRGAVVALLGAHAQDGLCG